MSSLYYSPMQRAYNKYCHIVFVKYARQVILLDSCCHYCDVHCLKTLVRYIKAYFRDTPGQDLINNEEFKFMDERGNAIQESEWEKSVQPGLKMDMNVIVRHSLLGVGNRCPKCTGHISPHSRIWCVLMVVEGYPTEMNDVPFALVPCVMPSYS